MHPTEEPKPVAVAAPADTAKAAPAVEQAPASAPADTTAAQPAPAACPQAAESAPADSTKKKDRIFYKVMEFTYGNFGEHSYYQKGYGRIRNLDDETGYEGGLTYYLRWYFYDGGAFSIGMGTFYHYKKFTLEDTLALTDKVDIYYHNIGLDIPISFRLGVPYIPIFKPFISQTFNFHKKPLGNVVFIGLDYTWMDLNFNQYDADSIPKRYVRGEGVINMPWHQKKMSLNYGMSIGPSLTLYPFTPTHNARAEKVRLQFYFHVGYSVGGAFIKDVMDKSGDKKNRIAWGHGLYTSYGANLTWNFIGLGYEWRNDNSISYKCVNKEFDTGKIKLKEKTSRVYLQFRF
jgi:hypothetical protein